MRDARPNRKAWAALLLILLGTMAAYLPSLDGEFVFDDHRFISQNPTLHQLSNLSGFFVDPLTMTAQNGDQGWDDIYRPLRTLSFAVSFRLFGLSPFAFRVESLLWHLAAVVCAFLLARRLLHSTGAAFAAAGFFALHPLQVESVGWISSRGDLMAATFLLGAALVLLRDRPSLPAILAGLLLFVLALFSKESAIALVAVVPIYDYCFGRRVDRRRLAVYSALLAIGVLFLVLRFSLTTAQLPFGSHTFASTGSAVAILGLETVFPVRIFPYTGDILPPKSIASPAGLIAFIGCVLATVVALLGARKSPGLAFGFLFAAVCLLPVSGIVPIKAPASSRFAYLSILGVGLMLGTLLRGRGSYAFGLLGVVLVALFALTVREGGTWQSDLVLWERAVAREQASLGRAGEMALSGRAVAWERGGDLKKAHDALLESIRVRPQGIIWANLGVLRLKLSDPEGALSAVREALALDPESAPVQVRAGIVFGDLGYLDEELRAFGQAAELAPEWAATHAHLGMALVRRGDPERAVVSLRAAVKGTPGSAMAHFDLARALQLCGRTNEAVDVLREAALLETDNPGVRANLGMAWLNVGRADLALPLLKAAVELDPGAFVLWLTLANAQAGVGRHEEARRSAGQAAALAESREQMAWVEKLLAGLR